MKSPWYRALYLERGDKTQQRDLHKLRELELVRLEAGRIWLRLSG